MAKDNNTRKSTNDKNNGKKRGKSAVTKKLDVLKKILKDGAKEHKDAIDRIIQQYNDYKNLSTLEKDLEAMQARVEAAKSVQANEAERKKAEEEAEKIKAEEKKAKKKDKDKKSKDSK